MKVFLDDLREISQSHNANKGLGDGIDFIIVRNDIDFLQLIDNQFDEIELVSFDHDLACFKGDWMVGDGHEFTGKTACEYIIDKCLNTGKKFPDWYVHTDNTNGRQNIIGLILHYIKDVDGIDISGYRYYHRGFVNGKFV